MTKTTSHDLSFEAALARLEQIVEKLDEGDLPLAQSIALFKEGTALAKRCRALLAEAEVHVKEVLSGSDDTDDVDHAESNVPSERSELGE